MERVALITGGAKGIGRSIALALAADGWSIAISYRTSSEAAEATASELRALGVRALALCADVSKPHDCERLVDAVMAELGRLDALFNNAGPYHRRAFFEETQAGWHEMFDNNLHPVFTLAQLVAPILKRQGWGRIVNFSMAGADRLRAQPFVTAHYIAKVGVLVLTRTLAKLLGPDGITVNALSPGYIDSGSTPLAEMEPALPSIPAGTIGRLEDVVGAARFLVSEEARYINGANLEISGGWGL